MHASKWPKIFPELTAEQKTISNDFMKYWHETISSKWGFKAIEKFNHTYPIKNSSSQFLTTLEIGAGLGEHLNYEQLTPEQRKNYVALEFRENMAAEIHRRFPDVQVCITDCQISIPYPDNYFDRVIAVHVLEHLANLPAAIQALYRVINKQKGVLSIVIPCEGGAMYTLARKISAQRIFEKRYKQPYKWFITREHVNKPEEIIEELAPYFQMKDQQYFPFKIPNIDGNLCIGMTLTPRNK